jgi:hypothetical protein
MCFAQTALNNIPIAECVGHREIYVYYGLSGTERRISKDLSHEVNVTIGIGDRFEFGFDTDLEGYSAFHAKAMILQGEGWAMSGGYQFVRENESESYLTGMYECGESVRLHLGWLENGRSRAFAGIEYFLSNDWRLFAETISGRDSSSSVGFGVPLAGLPGFDLMGALEIPHRRADGYSFTLFLGYSARF